MWTDALKVSAFPSELDKKAFQKAFVMIKEAKLQVVVQERKRIGCADLFGVSS